MSEVQSRSPLPSAHIRAEQTIPRKLSDSTARRRRFQASMSTAGKRTVVSRMSSSLLTLHAWAASFALSEGCVDQRCYEQADCVAPKICSASGLCVFECTTSSDCPSGLDCEEHVCKPSSALPLTCPTDMVAIANAFCIDRYEASRSDATRTSAGTDDSSAVSASGVLPWQVANNAAAEAACVASQKRLCSPAEWQLACAGPDRTLYAYGQSYEPTVCNGIDTHGRDSFHLMPTGSLPDCKNVWGAFDLNGNLWEHVGGGSDRTVRGGAYNCSDSATLHRCDYIPGSWAPSARGFRCCLTPIRAMNVDSLDDAAVDASPSSEAGCLVDDGDGGTLDVARRDAENETEDSSSGTADSTSDEDALVVDAAEMPSDCPSDMVPAGRFCIDRYEASRRDADAVSPGTDDSIAVSRAGVLPWYVFPISSSALATYAAACQAANKRLCSSSEWTLVCQGPAGHRYVFGDTWDAQACNSVDTYCEECCSILSSTSCPVGENCGYSRELSSPPYTPETCFVSTPYGPACHVCFHVMPTGSFPRCTGAFGTYDTNGNVWEIALAPATDDSRGYKILGGAFNCGSPSSRFGCTFNATWADLYAGFRCCRDRGPP